MVSNHGNNDQTALCYQVANLCDYLIDDVTESGDATTQSLVRPLCPIQLLAGLTTFVFNDATTRVQTHQYTGFVFLHNLFMDKLVLPSIILIFQ